MLFGLAMIGVIASVLWFLLGHAEPTNNSGDHDFSNISQYKSDGTEASAFRSIVGPSDITQTVKL
jgi:hypothetical protein